MAITRWSPLRELNTLDEFADRLMPGFWRDFPKMRAGQFEGWTIPLDVYEEGNDMVVKASLPGAKPDDIKVTLEDEALTIRAETQEEHETRPDGENAYYMRERHAGAFYRALRLPETVDRDNITSTFENGVLTVRMPRLEVKKNVKEIPVNTSS